MGSQCNKKLNIKLNILNAAASIYTYVPKKKKNYLPPVRKVVALQNKTDKQTQNLCIQYKQPQAQNLL